MEGYESILHLQMDAFVPPERRVDAFYSVPYEEPPTYLADSIMIKYASDCAVTAQIESHTAYLEAGDLMLVAPFARHRFHTLVPGGQIAVVALRPSAVRAALPRVFLFENAVRRFLERCAQPNGPLFLHLKSRTLDFDRAYFAEAIAFYRGGGARDEAALLLWEGRLERLLLTLLRDAGIGGQQPELCGAEANNLSHILGYIQRNLSDVSLQDAARELGWNASHLSRYLKARTRRSFTDIVQVLRLDEAATLLAHSDLPVEAVMERAGYTGRAHFYAIFRQRFGVTPAKYRRARRSGGGAL